MPGESLGDPVLSSDGTDLIYSRYSQAKTVSVVYEAFTSRGNPWPAGAPQSASLDVSGGKPFLPTGFSDDRLTLFAWDQTKSAAEAVFRSASMSAFGVSQPIGSLGADASVGAGIYSVQASHLCKRLYFVAQSGSNYVLQQEDAQ
jgi:hypothetical protein